MAKFEKVRQYRKKETGKLVFVYTVKGKAEELDQYREQAGSYLVEDDNGAPLFFSTRYVGESCPSLTTQDGRIIPDTTEMDMQVALAEQYGGNFGQSLADKLAAKMVAGGSRTAATGAKKIEKKDVGSL
jgi:hypothetical protein